MKRLFALILTVVLIGMSSVASADLLFSTKRFDFVMPDSWGYEEAGSYYACCQSSSGDSFNFYEASTEFPETLEGIVDSTANFFGLKDYVTGYEEIEISGQKTALIGVASDVKSGFITMFPKDDTRIVALYVAAGTPDKDLFVNVLSSVKTRDAKNKGFFRYDDVEVRFKNFTTKTSGGKKYLILNFDWRNVGTSPTMFVVNVEVTAFQDGIELHEGFLFGEQTEVGTQIMPGKELPVKVIFELRSSTGEVEFTVDKLMDFTNEAVARHYTLDIK